MGADTLHEQRELIKSVQHYLERTGPKVFDEDVASAHYRIMRRTLRRALSDMEVAMESRDKAANEILRMDDILRRAAEEAVLAMKSMPPLPASDAVAGPPPEDT